MGPITLKDILQQSLTYLILSKAIQAILNVTKELMPERHEKPAASYWFVNKEKSHQSFQVHSGSGFTWQNSGYRTIFGRFCWPNSHYFNSIVCRFTLNSGFFCCQNSKYEWTWILCVIRFDLESSDTSDVAMLFLMQIAKQARRSRENDKYSRWLLWMCP